LEWPWASFPWLFQVRGADPPMQFISEEDIGEILYRAVTSEVRGVFNAGAEGVVRFSELARIAGKKLFPIPAALLTRRQRCSGLCACRLFPRAFLK